MLSDPISGHDLRVLAVVPARGGSKGIPRKNMARINDLSLIARAAKTVARCDWIDGAVLSTDDPEFAGEGRSHGLDVPELRPAELASDTATGVAAWAHAWQSAEAAHSVRYDLSVYLQPTSPFRTPAQVRATVDLMLSGGHAAATTVSPVPGHYNPQKLLLLDNDGHLEFYTADGAQHSNRQSMRPCWTRNGLVYAARRAQVLERGLIVEENCAALPVTGYVANIDDPEDLLIARLLAREPGYDPHAPQEPQP